MMAIDRKLLRDLWRTRAQVASIALVLAGGVLAVVAIRGTASSLVSAREEYYVAGHFADVFASLTRAPDALRARLEALPGVAQVQTRVVKDVRLDSPGFDRPGTGRLISMPAPHEGAQRINRVRAMRGRALASPLGLAGPGRHAVRRLRPQRGGDHHPLRRCARGSFIAPVASGRRGGRVSRSSPRR